jgi:hypothetical protein
MIDEMRAVGGEAQTTLIESRLWELSRGPSLLAA